MRIVAWVLSNAAATVGPRLCEEQFTSSRDD